MRHPGGEAQVRLLRMSAQHPPSPSVAWVGSALGVAQLIAWGTIYYAIAVIGDPMQRDLALSRGELFGVFTGSLALSGLLTPWAGRLVDRIGGRTVLVAGAALGALGFGVLACAKSVWTLGVGWTIEGVAMALGLYDTCFAALGQAAPQAYRRGVTAVTLIAGLASSCFWPISHYLVDALGWRATCGVFVILLLLCVPIYLSVLPPHARGSSALGERAVDAPRVAAAAAATHTPARMLALAFAGTALVSGALSSHLVGALGALHFTPVHAVWIASSIGVMQVLGRFVELRFGAGMSAHGLGLLTFGGITGSLILLLFSEAVPVVVLLFAALYGTANGVLTIVKALVPVQMFGTREVGTVLGRFAAPSLIARAAAPWAFAFSEELLGGAKRAIVMLVGIAVVSLGIYAGVLRVTSGWSRASLGR